VRARGVLRHGIRRGDVFWAGLGTCLGTGRGGGWCLVGDRHRGRPQPLLAARGAARERRRFDVDICRRGRCLGHLDGFGRARQRRDDRRCRFGGLSRLLGIRGVITGVEAVLRISRN
jgi:hypothetical protein